MFFLFILIRILFAACMVFIIGYVFGSFSRNATLTTITKVASITAIVLFILANVLVFRGHNWCRGQLERTHTGYYQP